MKLVKYITVYIRVYIFMFHINEFSIIYTHICVYIYIQYDIHQKDSNSSELQGDVESFGLASSALLGGAPLVLGAQWDVLGGDLDKFASRQGAPLEVFGTKLDGVELSKSIKVVDHPEYFITS